MSKRTGQDDPVSRLAVLLAKSPAAVSAVNEARERPDEYAKTHKRELANLGVSANSPPRDLAWIVLMDALVKRGRAVVVDWRGSPEEVAADLHRMQHNLGEVTDRCLSGALRSGSASAFLTCVAKDLDTANRVLARIDPRPSDTAVVVVLSRDEFREAAALARKSGIGRVLAVTSEPLAVPPQRPVSQRKSPSAGSWKAVLQKLGVGNAHALLLGLAKGDIAPESVAAVAGKAPASDRRLIQAVLALITGERVSSGAAGTAALEAIRYLALVPGRELDALRTLLGLVRGSGTAKVGAKERRAAVQALRFGTSAEGGRTAFTKLSGPEQAFLRGLVSIELDTREIPALIAALDAAKVVGDSELIPKTKSLTHHSSLLVTQHAKETLRVLSRH